MVKKVSTLFILITITACLFAQYPKLSDNAKVVLFTCGPGIELYAGFGHSALWVSDPSQKIDRLYNYGTFDFDTPNFYGKFIRGKLNYMISVTRVNRFLEEYDSRKISVDGQLLNLSPEEKQRMFEFLENNLLPENRFYKYDFFYDNCATRIRDVLTEVVDGKINFNTADKNLTFREMLFPYLTHTPWTKFGINLILGLTSDKKATTWDYMYLPEYMKEGFHLATVENKDGNKALVSSETQYLANRLAFTNKKIDDPIVFFSFLLIIITTITIIEIRNKKIHNWLNNILFVVSCLSGLFLLFMWLGTDHIATAQNLNVLWLFPAQFVFLIFTKIKGNVARNLLSIAFVYQLLISFVLLIWPQEAEITFSIISLLFAVRIFGVIAIVFPKKTC